MEITKTDDTFRVEWIMEGGSVLGVGIFSNGVFAASYFGGAPAVVVYKVDGERARRRMDDGRHRGGGLHGDAHEMPSTGERKPPPMPRRRQPDRETGPVRGIRL